MLPRGSTLHEVKRVAQLRCTRPTDGRQAQHRKIPKRPTQRANERGAGARYRQRWNKRERHGSWATLRGRGSPFQGADGDRVTQRGPGRPLPGRMHICSERRPCRRRRRCMVRLPNAPPLRTAKGGPGQPWGRPGASTPCFGRTARGGRCASAAAGRRDAGASPVRALEPPAP